MTKVKTNRKKWQNLCTLNWAGKETCLDCLDEPLQYEFIPCPEESVNFDTTENLFFECDNLDALKYLQNTHLNKVKCIYIDPPYNTGKSRQYKDDFGDITGCKHSDWLNMMKPRLVLARELLSDDGVIFISIDDNEQAQLKILCDEVFGEENFIAEFVNIRSEGGGLAKQVIKGHDYVLTYCKSISFFTPLGRPKDIRGRIIEKHCQKFWIQEDWLRKEFGKYGHCYYEEIIKYKGIEKKKEIDEGIKHGDYILIPKGNDKHIVGKLRKVDNDASKFYTIIKHLSSQGIKTLNDMGLKDLFKYSKPTSLLAELILGATLFNRYHGGLVFDYFAGSGTTAHSTMQLNGEDGGKRKFILCQTPDPIDGEFSTIAELCKERIRRAGNKVLEEAKYKDIDVGFQVWKVRRKNNG